MALAAGRGAAAPLSHLHALLERPLVYAVVWRALAPGATRALLARIRAELAAAPEGRMLDVGCGPRSWLERAGAAPVGVDTSPAYARALYRSGGVAVVARAKALPFRTGSFGSVWCFGLLHHLSDEEARGALAEAGRVARPGRLVVFDAVLPRCALRRPLAWALRRLDRGGFLRGETAFRGVLPDGDWRVSRITYAWTGLEGLWCVR